MKGVGSPWTVRKSDCCVCSAPHQLHSLFSVNSLPSEIFCVWKFSSNLCMDHNILDGNYSPPNSVLQTQNNLIVVISPGTKEQAGTVGSPDFSGGQSLRTWACWKWVWFWKSKLVIKWCFLWGTSEDTSRAKTLQVIYYFISLNPNSNISSQ